MPAESTQTTVTVELETPHGPARAHLDAVADARGALVLGHGAGGGVGARDLVAAADAARGAGLSTALVEQPYRVAGRRSPAPAGQLDAVWVAVVEGLRANGLAAGVLVVGGRSSGARVACRTSAATRADAVLCLAFPLRPPGRAGKPPPPSRLPELEAVTVPTLVVQGQNDRFGVPPAGSRRTVAVIRGDHALRSDLGSLHDAVGAWLSDVLRAPTR
jgi:predicted alpha/beta-hydrolase family hydrolase